MTSEIVTVGTLLESYDIDDCGELFKVLPCLLGPITYEYTVVLYKICEG